MPDLKLVDAVKRVELRESYDLSLKYRLWCAFAAEHEMFVERRSGHSGRDSFTAHIDLVISDFLCEDGEIIDPTTSDRIFDIGTVTSKTIYNFLSRSLNQLGRVHSGTFRYVDAFISILHQQKAIDFQRPSFFETLGASTSLQYRPHIKRGLEESMEAVGREGHQLYRFSQSTSMVPGPMQAEVMLIWLERIESEQFYLVRIVPLTQKIEHSAARFSGFDKSDWNEEHYSGVAVMTHDGLSCHLTGMNARIPLYLLIKMSSEEGLSGAFISFDTPGYLLDYASLEVVEKEDIVKYFEQLPWIV